VAPRITDVCVRAVGALLVLVLAPDALRAQDFVARPLGSGFQFGTFATHAPGDPYRLYVTRRTGQIQILDLRDPDATPTMFLDLSAEIVSQNERGLLCIAFPPDYQSSGEFYITYTDQLLDPNQQIEDALILARRRTIDADTADPAFEERLLVSFEPDDIHFSGWIAFSPFDGYLWMTRGDGDQGDPGENAQNIETLLGSILRIDPSGTSGPNGLYGIPADNPFVGGPGRDEIWAYGIRNAWRASFDTLTGDLIFGDVGFAAWEEISILPADSVGGENFGWRCFEGPRTNSTSGLCDPLPAAANDPAWGYEHSQSATPNGQRASARRTR